MIMFWDRVAKIYDLFANVYNGKAHRRLCQTVNELVAPDDEVLECACGTGLLTVGIAGRCKHLTATDFSAKMLEQTKRKCRRFQNIDYARKDILHLGYADGAFDKVVAANVIHLLDEPLNALRELDRVCKDGGRIIIPTYINREKNGRESAFSKAVGKAGADFKRQFTLSTYRQFFADAGYTDVDYTMIEGRVPCAVAVIRKRRDLAAMPFSSPAENPGAGD